MKFIIRRKITREYQNKSALYEQLNKTMELINEELFLSAVNDYIAATESKGESAHIHENKIILVNTLKLNSNINVVKRIAADNGYDSDWSMLQLVEKYPDIPVAVLLLAVITTAEELINLKQFSSLDGVEHLLNNKLASTGATSNESTSTSLAPTRALTKRIVDTAFINFDCYKNSETYHFDRDMKSVSALLRECIKSYLEYLLIIYTSKQAS